MAKARPREKLPCDPDCRALEGATGVPVVLGDGNTWLLADGGLNNFLDPVRDKIWDESQLHGQVPMLEIFRAAEVLLLANYDLETPELGALIFKADHAALIDAVMEAMFGPVEGRKTYSLWATSALLANGLTPASIPVALLPSVLDQLVQCKRCVPADQYIDSSVAAPRLAASRARAAAYAARQAPPNGTTHEPAPETPPDA